MKSVNLQKIIGKCKNIIHYEMSAGSDWGAERGALKQIYTGLIRSNIDYGSIIYGSAAKTHLGKLDKIHQT